MAGKSYINNKINMNNWTYISDLFEMACVATFWIAAYIVAAAIIGWLLCMIYIAAGGGESNDEIEEQDANSSPDSQEKERELL